MGFLMNTKNRKKKIEFLILIIALSLFWYLGRYFRIDTEALQRSLARFPLFYSGILFVILYVIVTFFVWLSKDVFKLIAAVLFGAYLSTLLIWIAEIINAFILFYLTRYLGRGFVEKSLEKRYKNLDKRLSNINFFWLFLFRTVPLIPFRFLDVALGLTNISFRRYLIVVILGSPLRIFWLQYIVASVGKGIFNNPYALVEYLLSNKILLMFSWIYLILVLFVAIKFKKRNRDTRLVNPE